MEAHLKEVRHEVYQLRQVEIPALLRKIEMVEFSNLRLMSALHLIADYAPDTYKRQIEAAPVLTSIARSALSKEKTQ